MMAAGLVQLSVWTSGFVVPAVHTHPRCTRAATFLCAGDAGINEAAARVMKAAEQFGDAQSAAAAEWVEAAMLVRSDGLDPSSLLEKQQMLFEECLLEESYKCKELDLALTALEKQLKEDSGSPVEALSGVFGTSRVDRAAARVRTAAGKFGPEQEQVATLWVAELRTNGSVNPFALLEQQSALFDECLIDEDGESTRCKELEDALSALQASFGIRGKIVPTGGLGLVPKK